MIIGAFAGAVYGVTRVTFDIDIIVDLRPDHVDALAAAYAPPRYYADPRQMCDSIRLGIMFNIIDTSRGEKADLIPITMVARYQEAFGRRVRKRIETPGNPPVEVWCARPEDVIVGKLLAWAEGRSRKHETDIYEMMVFHYLSLDPEANAAFDESFVDAEATALGAEVRALWERAKAAALEEARGEKG
jgi:hypothetical protein